MIESNKMHQNKTESFLRAPVNAEIMKENRDEVIYVLEKFLMLDRNIRNYSPTKNVVVLIVPVVGAVVL